MDYLGRVSLVCTRQLGCVPRLGAGGGRAARPLHHRRRLVLSRSQLPAGGRPAVRPRVLGRAGKGASGGRRAAPHSDAGRACARSTWRWPARWRSARCCGRPGVSNQRPVSRPTHGALSGLLIPDDCRPVGSSLVDHSARSSTSLSVTVIASVAPSIATWPKNCRPSLGGRFRPCSLLGALM